MKTKKTKAYSHLYISLTPGQRGWVIAKSKKTGKSISSVILNILDEFLIKQEANKENASKENYSSVVNCRLDDETYHNIKKIAQAKGTSAGAVSRHAILQAIAKSKKGVTD